MAGGTVRFVVIRLRPREFRSGTERYLSVTAGRNRALHVLVLLSFLRRPSVACIYVSSKYERCTRGSDRRNERDATAVCVRRYRLLQVEATALSKVRAFPG